MAMYRPVLIILLFFSVQAHAQQHWLKGILLDKTTAESVAGAAIQSGADTTFSKKDGQFIIRTSPENLHLSIIHPGYKTVEITPTVSSSFLPLFISPIDISASQTDTLNLNSCHSDTVLMEHVFKAYRNETYKKEEENPFIKTGRYPYTAFTMTSGYAAYNNIRRFLFKDKNVPPASVRIGEMLNYFSFDDSIPVQYPGHPLQAYADFSTCPWNNTHLLMRIAVQSENNKERYRKPWNIVLLIDVSGSMRSPDKLPLLKIAFKQLIIQLRPQDTLSIITYTGKTKLTLPPTSGSEKLKMLNTITHLHAGGTTAGSKGIESAFKLAKKHFIQGGNNRVILATDGDFNVGKSTDLEMKKLIIQFRNWHIGLTCIGIGTGNYKDSKLETLAHWGQGTFAYIDNQAEALRIFNKEQFNRMATVARNVRLKVVFDPVQVRAFRLLGYDSGGKHARYAFVEKNHRSGGEIGAGQRMTAYVEIVPTEKFKRKDNFSAGMLILQYNGMPERKDYLQTYRPRTKTLAFRGKNGDWRFGASVVLFGMLLQQSEYIDKGRYRMVKKMMKEAKDAVPIEVYENYRKLLRKARKLKE